MQHGVKVSHVILFNLCKSVSHKKTKNSLCLFLIQTEPQQLNSCNVHVCHFHIPETNLVTNGWFVCKTFFEVLIYSITVFHFILSTRNNCRYLAMLCFIS